MNALSWLSLPVASRDFGRIDPPFGESDRLVFIHMEKTAGSSVHESLATLFPEEHVCPDRFSSINEHDADYLGQFRLFTAHGTLADFRNVPERRLFITFLRDPIERMISAYRYWSSARHDYIERADLGLSRLCKNRSLPDVLSDETLCHFPFLWNTYAQRLSGEPEIDPATDFRARSRKMLERALANLDNLAGVGIAEEVDLSFLAISNGLGVANPYDGRVLNVTADNMSRAPDDYEHPNPVEMNQETLDAIHRVTALDQVIYGRAVERLFHQLRGGLSYDCRPGPSTQIVELRGEPWIRQGTTGALVMFGPYLRLPASSYRVTVAIKRDQSQTNDPDEAVGLLEICCDGGTRVLRQRYLTNADVDRDRNAVPMMLSLRHRVDDIEVRFVSLSAKPVRVRRRIEVALV